ncbi:MAG: hypothetical protein R3Y28_06740 [Candidatus Gastranaerophilales bacterium]
MNNDINKFSTAWFTQSGVRPKNKAEEAVKAEEVVETTVAPETKEIGEDLLTSNYVNIVSVKSGISKVDSETEKDLKALADLSGLNFDKYITSENYNRINAFVMQTSTKINEAGIYANAEASMAEFESLFG